MVFIQVYIVHKYTGLLHGPMVFIQVYIVHKYTGLLHGTMVFIQVYIVPKYTGLLHGPMVFIQVYIVHKYTGLLHGPMVFIRVYILPKYTGLPRAHTPSTGLRHPSSNHCPKWIRRRSRKTVGYGQFFVGGSKFVSNYIRRFVCNRPRCVRQQK